MEKHFYSYNGPLLDVTYEKPFGRTKKEYVRAAANRKQAVIILKKAIAKDINMDWQDFRLDGRYLNELQPSKEKIVYKDDKYNPDDDVSGIQLSWFWGD